MSKRKEIKKYLKKQLKRLKEARVAELMKAREYGELKDTLLELNLNFAIIKDFFDTEGEAIYQTGKEIPKRFLYELACFIHQSCLEDNVYFNYDDEFQDLLLQLKEPVATHVANCMNYHDICKCTIKELLG